MPSRVWGRVAELAERGAGGGSDREEGGRARSEPEHARGRRRRGLEGEELASSSVGVSLDLDVHVTDAHDGSFVMRRDDLGELHGRRS